VCGEGAETAWRGAICAASGALDRSQGDFENNFRLDGAHGPERLDGILANEFIQIFGFGIRETE
jgi:hypothetical protein